MPAPQTRSTILALYKLVCMYVCVCEVDTDEFAVMQEGSIGRRPGSDPYLTGDE